MGKSETLRHHKTTDRTIRRGVNTQNTNYWEEEATCIFIIRLKRQSRYYNGRDSSMEDKRKMKGSCGMGEEEVVE